MKKWNRSIHGRKNIRECIGDSRSYRTAGRYGNGNGESSFARNTLGHIDDHRQSARCRGGQKRKTNLSQRGPRGLLPRVGKGGCRC